MKLSSELHLRALNIFAAACGVGTFVYGLNHLLAAMGSDWGFLEKSNLRSDLLWGIVLLSAGVLCLWVSSRTRRVLKHMDKDQRGRPLRALLARAKTIRDESLRNQSARHEMPKGF